MRVVGVDAETVWRAVCDPGDWRVVCPGPEPVLERVGVVCRGMAASVRTVVAEAVRSRRVETPYDHALARAERALAGVEPATDAGRGLGERVAELVAEESGLREEVARLGGRVDALRESEEASVGGAATELEEAVTRLAEVETERVAAEQRLEAVRERLRSVRATYEERRRLADRVDNLRREARNWLAATGTRAFVAAVESVPGPVPPQVTPVAFGGPDWVGVLAALVVADLSAPVVLGDDVGFRSATAAADALGVEVLFVEV